MRYCRISGILLLRIEKGYMMSTQRMTITLSSELSQKLQELASKDGISKSDAIRKALKLLDLVKREESKGESIAFVDEENNITTKVVGI